jgi:hypothetical protein
MKNKFKINNKKILEFDEKSYSDMNQIIKKYNEDSFNKDFERYNKDKTEIEHVKILYPDKGKKLWLEIDVEDSYSASMLYSWLFDNSKFDNSELRIFGSKLRSISYEKPSGYTREEKNAIIDLYKKIIGDE